ncbi:MAG: helix-turn-helix transcriptional regulator [Clostridia bacterium]|nr:helix-turn-helix transcriptional regulator [Clostridia bacterium]
MRNRDNICKFITSENNQKIYTTNFVYEKNSENKNTMQTLKTNAIYLVTGGKGLLCTESFVKELNMGNIFFTFRQIAFNIKNTEDLNFMYISFGGERSEELFTRFGITPNNCIFDGHEGLLTFWQNSIIKANQKNLDLISESVLLYTLGEMSPCKNSNVNNLIGNILKYIEDNFSDSELSLNSVSEALGYNHKYISRIFKDSMGVTFSAYLTNIRIQHATFLIEQGVTAIKNVSLLSGYKDPFYFSNVFKNIVGMTPSEYVKKKESGK